LLANRGSIILAIDRSDKGLARQVKDFIGQQLKNRVTETREFFSSLASAAKKPEFSFANDVFC